LIESAVLFGNPAGHTLRFWTPSAESHHAAASVPSRKFIAMIFLRKSVRLCYEKRTLFCLP